MADSPDKLLDAFVAKLENQILTKQEIKELFKEFGRLKVVQYKAWLDATYNDGYYYTDYLNIPLGPPEEMPAD